jgi:hypothetical protein
MKFFLLTSLVNYKLQGQQYNSNLAADLGPVLALQLNCNEQWKRISSKQSARWQHASWLKASALFSLQKNVSCMKHNNLYLGLVMPSSG